MLSDQGDYDEFDLLPLEFAGRNVGNRHDVESRSDGLLVLAEGLPEQPLPAVAQYGVAEPRRDAHH